MRKTLICSVLALLFIFQTADANSVAPLLVRPFQQNNITTTYDVRIKLVHTDGSPVTGSIGLHGFWAKNLATGVVYDPIQREGYEFEGLPAGTYTFGAY